jgi:SAM-dependent methyltransferase
MSVDLTQIARLYEKSLHDHGETSCGVGWKDEASHALRFDQLVKVIGDERGPLEINELGCGYGAFYEYLVSRKIDVTRFHGVDISVEMIERARGRLASAAVDLVVGSALDKQADYSFASGIFNVPMSHDESAWRSHILATLNNLASHSRRGFAFNLLSTYVDWRADNLYYGDPCFYFDHCKRNLSRHVSLLHDYQLWEWTLLVRV